MSSQEYIRSITEIVPDDFPTLTPLPDSPSSSNGSFFSNITWQTWIIIILILALLGINIFAYLAIGTQELALLFEKIFGPILKFFGYGALTASKQTVETSATGAKAGVDIVADVATDTIDTIQKVAEDGLPIATTGTSIGVSTSIPQGQNATSSLPVQQQMQNGGSNLEQWQKDSLVRALDNAKQTTTSQVAPDDSRSSIQTTGKSGWCFIGEEQGIRTCAEVGVNDVCMSGDVFPSQAVCMNPNLRA